MKKQQDHVKADEEEKVEETKVNKLSRTDAIVT